MALSWRYSVLADRHRALGSKLETGTEWARVDLRARHGARSRGDPHQAVSDCRASRSSTWSGRIPRPSCTPTAATSPKSIPAKSAYSCMLNDAGHFIETASLRMSPNAWMCACQRRGHETLRRPWSAECAMIVDDELHDLSLQGPVAVDFLRQYSFRATAAQVLPSHAARLSAAGRGSRAPFTAAGGV